MRLSSKLSLFIIPAISLSLLIFGVVAYLQLKQIAEEKQLENLEHGVLKAETLLLSKIGQGVKDSSLIGDFQWIKKYVLTSDEDQRLLLLYPSVISNLSDIQTTLPEYFEIRILMPDGYEEVRSVTQNIANKTGQEGDSELFSLVRNNEQTSSHILLNPDTGSYALYIVRPLILRDPVMETISASPKLRAFLVISVSLDDLRLFMKNNYPGEQGVMAGFLPDGQLAFSSGNQSVPDLPAYFLGGKKRVAIDKDYGYYRSSDSRLLELVSIIPASEMAAATNRLAVLIAFITIITLLGMTVLLYSLMRMMVIYPIDQLIDMSKEISQGNLQVVNQIDKEDEFGDLGRSIEQMASSLRERGDQIKTMAYRDNLTGTANRAMFNLYIKRVTARAYRNNEQYALLFIDIDNFKTVNDTKGHAIGDLLLREISGRLNEHIRDSDFIAEDITASTAAGDSSMLSRLGGDEFTVLLPDLKDPLVAGMIARRLIEVISAPFHIGGDKIYVGASIGITLYPTDSQDEDELLRFADIAMYHAKEHGKNNYQFYKESLNEKIQNNVRIESRLRDAVTNNSLFLEYQPQIALNTGRVVGVEALLRWNDPELGRIPPGEFIPVAEGCGEILTLGEWVINEACRQQSEWLKQGNDQVIMSINVSSIQFDRQDVSEIISAALIKHQIDPATLEVEITESTTMNDPEISIVKLNKVRSVGVSIALDDFGTGFSSLSHLLQFPIDVLKIDRNFVLNILTQKDSMSLVSTIIAMAHNLGMKVIAEGVEDQQQVDLLRSLHCDIIQGYVFSRPLGAEQIPDFINQLIAADVHNVPSGDSKALIS